MGALRFFRQKLLEGLQRNKDEVTKTLAVH
jgi:hypothetical protein